MVRSFNAGFTYVRIFLPRTTVSNKKVCEGRDSHRWGVFRIYVPTCKISNILNEDFLLNSRSNIRGIMKIVGPINGVLKIILIRPKTRTLENGLTTSECFFSYSSCESASNFRSFTTISLTLSHKMLALGRSALRASTHSRRKIFPRVFRAFAKLRKNVKKMDESR